MKYIYLLLILIIIYFIYSNNQEKFQENQNNQVSIIYCCATYFDFEKQDKWDSFCNGIDSILKYHPNILSIINKWYIVNEYCDTPKNDWKQLLKDKYPFITLYQKTKEQRGHPSSINLFLDEIRNYTYWINWEDSWYTSRPFLYDAINIMNNTDISQLQFTTYHGITNWLDIDPDRLSCKYLDDIQYCMVSPSKEVHNIFKNFTIDDYAKRLENHYFSNWPLFSLLPSINRVKDYNFGYFVTNLPSVHFELEYAYRWLKNNNTKAVLFDGPVIRDEHIHVSTH